MSCPFHGAAIIGGLTSRAVLFQNHSEDCALILPGKGRCISDAPDWQKCERNPRNAAAAIVAAIAKTRDEKNI